MTRVSPLLQTDRGFSPRRTVKATVFAICVLLVAPLLLLDWLEKTLTRSESLFAGISQLLALVPGPVGVWLRAAFYFGAFKHCSWETHVGFGSIFTHRGASLGRQASMGSYCVVGHADIGAQVMMASRISIPSGKRQHFDDSGQVTAEPRFDTVKIGAHTWIGEGAIVMADVGSHCVVSAGAVVVKTIPDGSLVGGNPGRVLKQIEYRADAVEAD